MRYLLIAFATIIVSGCAAQHTAQNVSKPELPSVARSTDKSQINVSPVDGVFEFVSRTTITTAPQQSTEQFAAPEWYGLWIFHDGYFSQTRMKNIRPDWTPRQFPSDPQGLGFDGASGTYTVKGGTIELKYMVNFYPGRIGAVEDLKYIFDNNTLTLTRELVPGPESRAAGQRITVLRKIR